ncbi:MAG: DNA-directed RNA polymerase subunit beta', partial [Candidatus Cloacimonetes bacterium 4572_65]
MNEQQDFDHIMLKLASPEQIRAWSYGEVKKPETINYRTLRPEKEGLFCERIFGTTKEWECYCGKFKSIRYKGVVCDRCGVEVTHFKVRRERMGHIELACPVSHIWYYRSVPSRMGLLLDLSIAALRSVLYYEKYIVIEPADTDLKKHQLLTEEEYTEARERFGVTFSAGMGGEAVSSILENLDLDTLSTELRAKMVEKGAKSDKRLLKRIEIVENFRDSGNRAEWMILDVIPVIPPELRPMVQLDGGRFATSDLNDLYRRVINRNNRLKRLMSLHAPDIIIRNEKRMLQEAVDALFDNSKKKKVVKGASNRPLKSLSDMLKGKQGRFRQNLLGKRVDYSGRSVIVVGPNLKLHQCGLPAKMALELFKPFIMKKLVEQDIVYNIKKAKSLVEHETPEVWAVLDEVVKEHPVLLNRAPTLHRLGVQAFEPVLVEGKAIKLHPLVCNAFNADFDGDQMAVHVPLTKAAQIECWTLMLSDTNLMSPANGQPVVYPSQDMVLGIYHLTSEKPKAKGTGKYFSSSDEVLLAVQADAVEYQALINVELDGEWIKTTPGRLIFNDVLPDEVSFVNYRLGDDEIRALITHTHEEHGAYVTVNMLDIIKNTGYKYATIFGASIGVDDILIPSCKKEMIADANAEESKIINQYMQGHITSDERYNKVVEVWSTTNEKLTNEMMDNVEKDQDGFNNIYMMANSGARGSRNQIRQLSGMRGLMAKPSGDIIELPIRSNFKEGLSVIEFFISTNGARKISDKQARKIEEVGVESVKVRTVLTCEAKRGVCRKCYGRDLSRNKNVNIGEAVGIVAAQSIGQPGTQLTMRTFHVGGAASAITEDNKIALSYPVLVKKMVGQSVPLDDGKILFTRKGEMTIAKILDTYKIEKGDKLLVEDGQKVIKGEAVIERKEGNVEADDIAFVVLHGKELLLIAQDHTIEIRNGSTVIVTENQIVPAEESMAFFDPFSDPIIAEFDGITKYEDIIPGSTLREEVNEDTGNVEKKISDTSAETLQPRILIVDDKGKELAAYFLPNNAYLSIDDGEEIKAGTTLAKLLKESAKTQDITGGLPRVGELFEARHPREVA